MDIHNRNIYDMIYEKKAGTSTSILLVLTVLIRGTIWVVGTHCCISMLHAEKLSEGEVKCI